MRSSNLIGQTLLNRFRVDSFVAAGGMGAVYKVWDLQRSVYLAMKVLHTDLAEDTAAFRRFKREADHLKDLAHPNIVPFYGLYEDGGLTFLLEGFVNGPTLKDILRQRRGQPLSLSEAMIYLQSLCAPLGYAHSLGIIHCDVKPGNVMIDASGFIYLTDFGIARHTESATSTLGLTGTPAYMAPEQIRGERLTPAADIYALGVMLFEMLTGRRPFLGNEPGLENSGATPGERIRAAHLQLPPPDPQRINSVLSPAIAAVVLKALEKDPASRFASATELFQTAAQASGMRDIPNRVQLPFPAGAPQPFPAAQPQQAQPAPAPRWSLPSLARTCLMIAAGISLLGAIALALIVNQMRGRTQSLLPVPTGTSGPVGESTTAAIIPTPPTATGRAPSAPPVPASPPTPTATAARPAPTLAPVRTNLPAPTTTAVLSVPPTGADRWTSPKDGMLLIRIPSGPFLMGSDQSPWDFERPQHTVTLDEYWIDQVPVTNAMFAKFIEATGYRTHAEQIGWGYTSPGSGEFQTNGANWRHPMGSGSDIAGKDRYPVVQVTWDEAQAYCKWAGRRLLTEAEWEKAARGDDGRLYPWGNTIDCSHANYSNGNNSYCTGGITAVDAYPSGASPYDVLDMAGNTFDWVADWYQADYYRVSPTHNPTGPATGQKRVHRGGAWYNFNLQVQTTYRFSNPPDWSFGSVGIRCGYTK